MPSFQTFYANCTATIHRFAHGSLEPQLDMPANALDISTLPWVAFTSFDLAVPTGDPLPILTIGKHCEREGRPFLPLAIRVHHAVSDGWHLGQFVGKAQRLAVDAERWLR